MTITAADADALDALALTIFNLNLVPNDPAHAGLGAHYDPTRYTGIKGQDDTIDAQYYALIAPVMLAIDGRAMPPGFKYTLNMTNALDGRPYHWFFEGLDEFPPSVLPPCNVAFSYYPGGNASSLSGDFGSYGFYLAGALCAGLCRIWATIIRLWLAGNYPLALTQPIELLPPGWAAAPIQVGGYLTRGGTIFKITAQSGFMWQAQFYADTSGNFPVNDTYETTLLRWFNLEDGILGVKPAVVSQ